MNRRGDEGDGPDLDDDERDVNNKIDDFIDDLLVHHLHGFEVPVVSEHFLTRCLSEYLKIFRVFANIVILRFCK